MESANTVLSISSHTSESAINSSQIYSSQISASANTERPKESDRRGSCCCTVSSENGTSQVFILVISTLVASTVILKSLAKSLNSFNMILWELSSSSTRSYMCVTELVELSPHSKLPGHVALCSK